MQFYDKSRIFDQPDTLINFLVFYFNYATEHHCSLVERFLDFKSIREGLKSGEVKVSTQTKIFLTAARNASLEIMRVLESAGLRFELDPVKDKGPFLVFCTQVNHNLNSSSALKVLTRAGFRVNSLPLATFCQLKPSLVQKTSEDLSVLIFTRKMAKQSNKFRELPMPLVRLSICKYV